MSGVQAKTIQAIEAGRATGTRPATRRKLAEALRVLPHKLILDVSETAATEEASVEDLLRAELRGKTRTLRRAYDALRDPVKVTHRFQDDPGYPALLAEIERELKGA